MHRIVPTCQVNCTVDRPRAIGKAREHGACQTSLPWETWLRRSIALGCCSDRPQPAACAAPAWSSSPTADTGDIQRNIYQSYWMFLQDYLTSWQCYATFRGEVKHHTNCSGHINRTGTEYMIRSDQMVKTNPEPNSNHNSNLPHLIWCWCSQPGSG